ncbi:MAG TPA: alpha/beta hydrolase [Pseudonocardiaceae bacterium]
MTLWVEQGGSTEPGTTLVLLHGLGHTAEVWRPLLAELPPSAGWLIVDLPGHGRSPWREQYWFDGVAAEVAAVLPEAGRFAAVGHSFGGVVALALAAAQPAVRSVLGFGIKVAWGDDELAAMRVRATRPPRVLPTEEEARAAFVRFGGLDGVLAAGSPAAASGVTAVEGGWQLATDPQTMAVGAPDMPALLAGAARHGATVTLAAGADDHMVTPDQLRAVTPEAVIIPGTPHNLHVTHPRALLDLLPL